MRIVCITRVWPTMRGGGLGNVCQDRAHALARAGHEVYVITTSNSTQAGTVNHAQFGFEGGGAVTVVYTSSPAHQWSPEFAHECATWIKALKPGIVHSDSFDRDNIYWTDLNVPFHITMHGMSMGGWLTDWNLARTQDRPVVPFPEAAIRKEIAALKTAKSVIGISKWEYRTMCDFYGLTNAKLVYNPIAPYFFDNVPTYDPKTRKAFLCAAVSQGNKRGFEVVRQAAKRAGVKLHVVTDVVREQMPAIYDKVRAIVLPTAFAQGKDLSLCEARARGVPAIISPTGSYWDDGGEWDQYSPIGDVDRLAGLLSRYNGAIVPAWAADAHRPEVHVTNWLNAIN